MSASLSAAERRRILVEWNDTRTDYPRDACVHELFEAQALRTPEAVAATCDGEELLYGELNRLANRLAHRLRARGVGPDVSVGILTERSLPALVGQLGILKAGGAYVPLDPRYPEERLRLMLADTAAPVLVGNPDVASRLSYAGPIVDIDEPFSRCVGDEGPPVSGGGPDHLAYVMFTSGSTGRPKGVAVQHRGIVRLVRATNYVTLDPSDRVLHAASLSFDASTFEIWGALLNGARLVIVGPDTLLSPRAFVTMLRREGITVAFLTTALFRQMAGANPEAFAGLAQLFVGGEAMDPRWLREVLEKGPPGRFVHVYGPTENTTFSTFHPVDRVPPDAASIPIGRPISNTRAYILDEDRNPVPVGESGELYVGGDGLARGYVARPQLTAERFVAPPFAEEPGRLYKTGDRARYLPDGAIEFLGRTDSQVKIRGFRVELGEIESVLAASPTVREAVVVVREDVPGDKRLVAYVVSSMLSNRESVHHVSREDLSPAERALVERTTDAVLATQEYITLLGRGIAGSLKGVLREKLPEYMIPSDIVILRALPLTPAGKVDRRALPPPGGSDLVEPRSPIEDHVLDLWTRLLRKGDLNLGSDFFELGGNSLLAVEVLLDLQRTFGVELLMSRLFAKPTVSGVAAAVEEAKRGDVQHAPAVDLRAEAAFPAELLTSGERAPRHIFLTGATGFVGAFLLEELTRRTKARIHCLVRARSEIEGLVRIRKGLEQYGLWHDSMNARIIPIPGDLAMPLLGLPIGHFEALSDLIDVIYHSGAEINYVNTYAAHRSSNVCGTLEVLRLASLGKPKLLCHLSTIAVFGHIGYFTGRAVAHEDDDIEPCADYLSTDLGYSQSKWVAERLVLEARARGVPVIVFRPGFVLGHSKTGASNTNDFVARMIKGCIQLGYYPELPAQSKECLPVDFASRAIAHLSLTGGNTGKIFHLVPGLRDKVDLLGLFRLVAERGYPLQGLPYDQWLRTLLARLERTRDNPLLPLVPMLSERVYQGSRTRWEMSERMPLHDCRNTLAGLAGTDIVCPPLSAELLDVYFSYYARAGFLQPPEV